MDDALLKCVVAEVGFQLLLWRHRYFTR